MSCKHIRKRVIVTAELDGGRIVSCYVMPGVKREVQTFCLTTGAETFRGIRAYPQPWSQCNSPESRADTQQVAILLCDGCRTMSHAGMGGRDRPWGLSPCKLAFQPICTSVEGSYGPVPFAFSGLKKPTKAQHAALMAEAERQAYPVGNLYNPKRKISHFIGKLVRCADHETLAGVRAAEERFCEIVSANMPPREDHR